VKQDVWYRRKLVFKVDFSVVSEEQISIILKIDGKKEKIKSKKRGKNNKKMRRRGKLKSRKKKTKERNKA
jgi:hypothetical protein